MAVLEPDVAELASGLETVSGPIGVKLSGGQTQSQLSQGALSTGW